MNYAQWWGHRNLQVMVEAIQFFVPFHEKELQISLHSRLWCSEAANSNCSPFPEMSKPIDHCRMIYSAISDNSGGIDSWIASE
jgi:hypothetical protein